MFRALTILTALVALAVSAAPASAAGTAGRVGGKMHLEDISMGIITGTSPTTPKTWWTRSR